MYDEGILSEEEWPYYIDHAIEVTIMTVLLLKY